MRRRNLIIGGAAIGAVGLAASYMRRGNADARAYETAAAALRMPGSPRDLGELGYLVHHATLAANSHNTQPWLFSGDASTVTISPDLSRATPAVDPDNHHLFASLGCAVENLVLAAAANGRPSTLGFAPEGGNLTVDLGSSAARRDPLFDAIAERQCTRSVYDGHAVSAADLKALEAAAQVEGCSMILVTDKNQMERMLELIVAANSEQIADPAFVAELKSWLRFNAGDALSHGDGLYSACSGNPTMPGWIADLAFGLAFTAEAENAKCVAQSRSSAGFAVFVSDQDDARHWVQAGRSCQRFALAATAMGLSHAFLNQPVEVPRYRRDLADLLGTGGKRPDLVVRFGRAKPMPRSLRRPLQEVIAAA